MTRYIKAPSDVGTCGLCYKIMCKECLKGDHKCETPEEDQ